MELCWHINDYSVGDDSLNLFFKSFLLFSVLMLFLSGCSSTPKNSNSNKNIHSNLPNAQHNEKIPTATNNPAVGNHMNQMLLEQQKQLNAMDKHLNAQELQNQRDIERTKRASQQFLSKPPPKYY